MLISCKTSKQIFVEINGLKYVSVKSFGAEGDGNTDDVNAIQNAINKSSYLYFPPGKYILGHAQYNGTNNPFALLISTKSKCRNIYFEKGSELFFKDHFGKPNEKYCAILLLTDSKSINEVILSGINISANKGKQEAIVSGIQAIESKGNIKKLTIENANIKNLTGGGINTFALHTTLKNVRTENLGGHGIGAANPYHLNQEHYLYIDQYTSLNDEAYSIDFSGAPDGEGGKFAKAGDVWTGNVKNVTSINSKFGIKTAGHWNLTMDSVYIEASAHNGFSLSKDALGRTVTISNMTVKDCKDSGVFLAGKSNFVGSNIVIENCRSGLYVDDTSVKVKGLIVDGKGKNSIGIRVQGNAEISDFKVTGLEADYPVWVTGKNVSFKNGTIYNNEGPYSFLVHEDADNVQLEDINFYDDRKRPKQIYGYMILQKKGNISIRYTNRDARKPQIENRSGILIRN